MSMVLSMLLQQTLHRIYMLLSIITVDQPWHWIAGHVVLLQFVFTVVVFISALCMRNNCRSGEVVQ